MENSSFSDKKKKVLEDKKKASFSGWFVLLIVLAVLLGGVAYWLVQGESSGRPELFSKTNARGERDDAKPTLQMTDIQVRVENGHILIPVDVLKEKKIVRFEYESNGVKVPLYAYLTLAGRVVTGISMCEPCKSTRFRIQDRKLVCNACDTEWHLETHKGIKGGCMNYPPEIIPHRVENDSIMIEEKVVLEWKPRV